MPVRSLTHYALEVPDQQVGQRFYTDFGFEDATGSSNAVRLRPKPLAREQILLYEGPKKRLRHLAFAAPGEDFAAVRASLRAAGVAEIDPPQDAPAGGVWVRDPDGQLVNVREEAPVAAPADPPLGYNNPGNPVRVAKRAIEPPVAEPATPRRLGHVMLFSPDIERQRAFYVDVLGLKLSDRVPGLAAFLRCSADHHNVALVASDRPGFHHASFEVGGIDEIALGAERMRERGWEPAWGLGRHAIGSNFFYYTKDPWGSYAEYYADLDYIPDDCAWQARDWDPQYALMVWGPAPPDDFIHNKEE
ncbi:MAG TPA: VOC family protein [Chloroflexota bacterium]|jgi:catechol 2,3-dioxygenase-like lactoylglutathione lyase family enzyme